MDADDREWQLTQTRAAGLPDDTEWIGNWCPALEKPDYFAARLRAGLSTAEVEAEWQELLAWMRAHPNMAEDEWTRAVKAGFDKGLRELDDEPDEQQ
jgi:hypothetical protein